MENLGPVFMFRYLLISRFVFSLMAIFFVWKWKLWRKENWLNREKLVWKIIFGLFVGYLIWFWGSFGYGFYKGLNGFKLYKGDWYAEGQLPREATEEFGEYRKQLREAPTTRDPEETYKLFREALLREDFDGALGFISEKKKGEYAKVFEDKTKVIAWVKKLPEKIEKEYEDEVSIIYSYELGDQYYHSISFKKNLTGIWTIDRI